MKLNRKNKILIAGFFVSLYVCYTYAFSNTLDYYRKYAENLYLEQSAVNNSSAVQQLSFKEKQLDKLLDEKNTATGNSFQNVLLKQITSLSAIHNLKIVQFAEPVIHTDKNSKTYTYTISLQGSFNGMLMLINALENKAMVGIVKNVNFIKQRNYKTNSDYLTCTIILQRTESIKNNTTP